MTTVELGMGVADTKILLFRGISEVIVDKEISTRYYNNRTFYAWFNKPFIDYCGGPSFNIPPITIYYSPHIDKRSRYNPDLLPSAIYFASENSGSTFTTTYDLP